MKEAQRGSATVVLPALGKLLIFGATCFPLLGLTALGHGRGLLEGHANLQWALRVGAANLAAHSCQSSGKSNPGAHTCCPHGA